jgi:hypothetical protein
MHEQGKELGPQVGTKGSYLWKRYLPLPRFLLALLLDGVAQHLGTVHLQRTEPVTICGIRKAVHLPASLRAF